MNKFIANYSVNENESGRIFRNRLFLAQSVVFLFFLINAFRANTIPNILILAAAMIVPFFLRPKETAAYIVSFAMMGTGIQVAYIALSCLISLILRSKMKIRIITSLSIFVFILYELVHLAMSPYDDVVEFLRYVIVYVLLFYIMFMDYDELDKIRIVDSFIYGTIFSILHIFIETFMVFNGDLLKFIDGSFRFGYSEQLGVDLTMAADPNAVGQGCSIIIVVCLMLIVLGYKNKRYYAAALIALLVGTLTISKTFLLSMAMSAVFVILSAGSWTSTKIWGKRILLLALIAIGCFVVVKFNPSYIENILSRVDETDITTGRIANAGIYLDYLSQNLLDMLFGVGMQNVGEKIGFTGSPHSMLIEALICWGIVGTLAVLSIIIYAIQCHTKKSKPILLNWVPLIVYTVIMQTTQLFRLRDRVFTLLVVIIAVGISQKGEKQSDCQKKSFIGH